MSFFGINLASRALDADQQALEVVGQNITNVNTPGYSRQDAVLQAVPGVSGEDGDLSGSAAPIGGGVDVATVQRTHAAFLDRATNALTVQVGQNTIANRYATQVENLLEEPTSGGLQSIVSGFLGAFSSLANNPTDQAARANVVNAGNQVAQRFTQLTQGLQSLQSDAASDLKANLTSINSLLQQVASLNGVITQSQASGSSPNELMDQRDQLVQQLTQQAGVTVNGQSSGSVVISLGGKTLVQGSTAESLTLLPGAGLQVAVQGTTHPVTISGGELKAEQDQANTILPGLQSQLAGVRDAFAATVNQLHQSGTDASGQPGLPFFTADSGGNITVNSAISADPSKVVTGTGDAGDTSVALAISNLSTSSNSPMTAYQGLVAQIGAQSANSTQVLEQSQNSLQQIQSMQASESGVNLDEELAQMVSLQHNYSASARLLSTYDQMLNTLINNTGA